jgi:hypothetical protein
LASGVNIRHRTKEIGQPERIPGEPIYFIPPDQGYIAMTNLDLKLKDLDIFHGFIRRHIGPGAEDEAAMLAELGMDNVDELLDKVVP